MTRLRGGAFGSVTRFAAIALLAVGSSRATAQRPTAERPAAPAASGQPSTVDSAAAARGLRMGFLVRPDTVTVGDAFALIVTIEVPVSATVQWPVLGDTAAAVAMRVPTRVTTEVTGSTRRERAEYSLAAWRVGLLPIAFPDVVVRLPSGVVTVPVRDARVFVATVLPGDTSLHVPKPARPLFPRVVPWWEAWWPPAAVVAALLLLWWLWRRRRSRVVPRVAASLDVFARAMHDFDRLQRLALADVGERGRAVALSVEILRTYLAARITGSTLAQTSPELLAVIGDDDRVPRDRLASLLEDADAIKFAHQPVSLDRSRALQGESRAIVEAVEAAEQARRVAEERARRDALREAQAQAKAEEERARRASRRPKVGAP